MVRFTGSAFAELGWPLIATLALLSGCASTPPSRFYVLTPRVEAKAKVEAEEPGVFLLVGPVEVAAYLDRPQIVTRSGENEVELAEFDRWAQSLKESLPKLLGSSLSALLGRERVFGANEPALGEPRFRVGLSVSRFDGAIGGDVVLEARWLLLGGPDARDPQLLSIRTSRIVKPAGSDGYRSLVAGMSEAVADLCREIAAAVMETSS